MLLGKPQGDIAGVLCLAAWLCNGTRRSSGSPPQCCSLYGRAAGARGALAQSGLPPARCCRSTTQLYVALLSKHCVAMLTGDLIR